MSEVAIATGGSRLDAVRGPRKLNPSARTHDQSGIYTPKGACLPSRSLRKTFLMPPILITGFFLVLGLYSLWALANELRTGIATGRRSTIDVRENPGGFCLLIFIKAAFVCFAVAVLLNALGLIGDPFVWMRQNLPFLMPR
jgi:hypothetical protein